MASPAPGFEVENGVWFRPGAAQFAYSDGDEAEEYLLGVIERAADRSCGSDELVRAIRDWPSEYHLSPGRQNLFRALSFQSSQRVLEVGSGGGAMTRYLGEQGCSVTALEGSRRRARTTAARCRGLDNVEVVCDDFARFSAATPFDVVTLIGVLEYAPVFFSGPAPARACLRRAANALREDGTLVVAIENRFGLKYFNGACEDHTQRRFDSINDLYTPGGCQTHGREELAEHLREAGFTDIEFLYPFPDYKLPRLILREQALQAQGFDPGLLTGQYPARDYMRPRRALFSERLAWPIVAANGLLPALANSFLVLARRAVPGASLLGEQWLAKTWNTARVACFHTENVFREQDGALRVHRRLLHDKAPVAGPLRHRGAWVEGHVGGALLSQTLARLVFLPDAQLRYAAYLGRYVEVLRSHRQADGTLPAECFDCIPGNLVVDPQGACHYIDAEWTYDQVLPFEYQLFRGIVHDLSRVADFGSLALFAGHGTVRDFVADAMRGAGHPVTDERLDDFVAREQKILNQVVPGGDRQNIIHRLHEAPSAVFESVTCLDPPAAEPDVDRQEFRRRGAELARTRSEIAALRGSTSYRLGRALVDSVGAPAQWVSRWRRRRRLHVTVVCHFWNNAWILPYWLRHHARLFDHGIMIDHGASDDSVEIIRRLVPRWEIRPTVLCRDGFVAEQADREVMAAEREISGWKMVLNVTEFLMQPDLKRYIASLPPDVRGVTSSGVVLVDLPQTRSVAVTDAPLYLQKRTGYFEYELGKRAEDYGVPGVWRSRLLHCYPHGDYETGRHVTRVPHVHDPKLFLAWAGWAPFDALKDMKMAVQSRIPPAEFERGFSVQHRYESHQDLEAQLQEMQQRSHDLLTDPDYAAALRRLRYPGWFKWLPARLFDRLAARIIEI